MNEIYDLDAVALRTIDALTAAGADAASCTVKYSELHEFNYEGDDFTLFRTLFNTDIILTSIKDGRRGTASINSFEEEAIAAAVVDCLAAGEATEPDAAWDIAPAIANGEFIEGETEPDVDGLFTRTRELVEDIKVRHPAIVIESMTADHTAIHRIYRNSKGARFEVRGGYYSCDPSFSAHEGEHSSSFYYSTFLTHDLSRRFIDCGSMERDLADNERQIYTRAVDGKFVGRVILMPGCVSELIGTALENFAGDSGILDGTSVWLDKLGSQVADERLTVTMAACDPRLAISDHYTAEGYPAENYKIIDGGVLRSFDISDYVAKKTGHERALNDTGRFVIEAGDCPLDSMIASIDRGLIVARFSGGEPAANGDFSGVAKNSFIIEGGRITGAAAETMISGNLADMLMNIADISRETVEDGAMVLPYISFDGITISGK